jgi:hypothetical protein
LGIHPFDHIYVKCHLILVFKLMLVKIVKSEEFTSKKSFSKGVY